MIVVASVASLSSVKFAGAGMFKVAFLLQLFVMIMLIVWAFTNFCPSTYILKKILPPCNFVFEGGGDANGFVEVASVATALKLRPGATVTTGTHEVYVSASTRGALLVDTFTAGSDAVEDTGTYVEMIHRCDGTAKTVTYTGSAGSDTAAGVVWLTLAAEGLGVVAKVAKTADATSGAVNVWSESLI